MKHNMTNNEDEDEASLAGLVLALALYGFAGVCIMMVIAAGF